MESMPSLEPEDKDLFRKVMGRVPTGVTVITAKSGDGQQHGLVVGSFTSLSLDPPLVAFMPAKSSTTFPAIHETGHFCVNVLAADQAEVCRAFFGKDEDRFDRWEWNRGATGAPVLTDALAWVDCEIVGVHDGGDHHIVVGQVKAMHARTDVSPLIFFSGGYGRFSGHSLAAWRDASAVEQLRYVDLAHSQMQSLSRTWEVETLALVREETDMLVLASTGSEQAMRLPTRVGLRLPIVPPMGALLVAWDDDEKVDWWLSQADSDEHRKSLAHKLEMVRTLGYSMALSGPDSRFDTIVRRQSEQLSPRADELRSEITEALEFDSWEPDANSLEWPVDVRTLSAPVLTPRGTLAFMLTVFGPGRMSRNQMSALRDDVVATAGRITDQIAAHAARGDES